MFCSSSLENSKTSCCCKSSMSTRSRLGSLTNLHALLDRNSTRGARRRQLRSFRVQPPLLRGSCNREINNFNSCNISASTLLVSRRSRSQLGFQFSRSQNNIHVSSAPRLQRSRRLGPAGPAARRAIILALSCLVGARFLALVISKNFLPLITVSNKVSLQNKLQNPALVTIKNLTRHLTAQLEYGYCSITVAIID